MSSSLFFEDADEGDGTSYSKREYEQIVKPRFLIENPPHLVEGKAISSVEKNPYKSERPASQ